MGMSFNKDHARSETGRAEKKKQALARLKLGSFWIGKPREGWTALCAVDAELMTAGPCGSYKPSFDMAYGCDASLGLRKPGRKGPAAFYPEAQA